MFSISRVGNQICIGQYINEARGFLKLGFVGNGLFLFLICSLLPVLYVGDVLNFAVCLVRFDKTHKNKLDFILKFGYQPVFSTDRFLQTLCNVLGDRAVLPVTFLVLEQQSSHTAHIAFQQRGPLFLAE